MDRFYANTRAINSNETLFLSNKNKMKLIKDNSHTPIELARLKYRKLYEQQQIFKAERKKHLELSTKNLIFNFLNLIN